MSRLKINLEAIERDCNTNAEGFSADGRVRVGSLLVSSEGVRDSEGHYYELSLNDFDVVPEAEGGFLGRGSSGSVRRATHRRSSTAVALKEIKVSGKAHMSEIRRELETLHAGDSATPYLVNFYGAFTHEGAVFIAMEAMDGSLQEIAKPTPLPVLACITRQMLKGLFYLHRIRHLMHRDLKPSNVLYNSRTGDIKISDFGVSSFLECTKADAHSFVGTVTYMSPERLHGDSYSYGADIWSLGLVVGELALGACPFAGLRGESSEGRFWALIQHLNAAGPALELPEEMDGTLADFINACVVKSPEQRATCSELLQHPFIKKYATSKAAPASPPATVNAARGGSFLTPPPLAIAIPGAGCGKARSPVLSFPAPTRAFEGFPGTDSGGPGSGAGSFSALLPTSASSSPPISSLQERHEDEADEDFADHLVIQQWLRSMEERATRHRHRPRGSDAHHHKPYASPANGSSAGNNAGGSAANTVSTAADGEHASSHSDEGWEQSHDRYSSDGGSACALPHDGTPGQQQSFESSRAGGEPSVNLDEELNKLLL
ncbi:putative protein kinase [Leptomonas pyrrhocoris]|uniref:mitogen-activated protein kinase kinase n=1 Tax=Leptomonas pyrrhocoris TaxID=157538 RepID=A0A0M9G0W1_LEPPY|nr:putative protein kinase [Leptomonas pyrrhocoris]KPA79953.1 putative protein kinase [Leptomonas pyrrhocoris]|eukprot:XP_015658392.1 putative protein kinase [Leptomonas pyrrhocoris]